MATTTAEDLASLARELELIQPADLVEVWRELGTHNVPIDALGSTLVRRELLTGYQWGRLCGGYRQGFFFGRAKVLYQAGAGSFARVYRAINVDTGVIQAVKVLRKRFAQDAEKCRLFLREGEMGLKLRHPGIVRIDDVGMEDGISYITMEFVEGQTLRELVKIRGAIDLDRAVDIIQQIIVAAEYAHGQGVTHRDLKPSNVLVSSTGQAKLVDFGLASFVEAKARRSDEAGKLRTIDYATLENITGARNDDVRSDLFFLGTLFYLALSGTPALVESRDRATRADPRRYTDIQPLGKVAPRLPRDLVDLVTRMMAIDPAERFQTAAEVRGSLEPIADRIKAESTPTQSAAGSAPVTAAAPKPRPSTTNQRRIMIVELSGKSQDSLRQFFSQHGFRVLVTENPDRALNRFSSIPRPADCLLLSAQTIGEPALTVFNHLASDPYMKDVSAVLITSARQTDMAAGAKADSRRQVLTMPFKASELLDTVNRLVEH